MSERTGHPEGPSDPKFPNRNILMPKTIILNPWLLPSPPARPNPWSNLVHFKEDRSRVWVYPTVNGTYDPATQVLTYEMDGEWCRTSVSAAVLSSIALPTTNSIILTQEQAAELGPSDTVFLLDLSKKLLTTTSTEELFSPQLLLS